MGITVGFGVAVGTRVAVDVGGAACMPVQLENARQDEIKTMNIRLYLFLMVTTR
jgi:hypothetical protein